MHWLTWRNDAGVNLESSLAAKMWEYIQAKPEFKKIQLTNLLREIPVLTLSARPPTLILPVRPVICAQLFALCDWGTPPGPMRLDSTIIAVAVEAVSAFLG